MAATTDRLTRAERREQLLDSAAALLLEKGRAALTIEGVAARAGVSKALPYSHFTNAEHLVCALRDRELRRIADAVLAAVTAVHGLEAQVGATIHAYFDVIRERGAILGALQDGDPARDESGERVDVLFFTGLFRHQAGLSEQVAHVAAGITVTAIAGAVDAWLRRVANRATVEATLVRLVVAGVEALVAEEAAGRLPVPSSRPG